MAPLGTILLNGRDNLRLQDCYRDHEEPCPHAGFDRPTQCPYYLWDREWNRAADGSTQILMDEVKPCPFINTEQYCTVYGLVICRAGGTLGLNNPPVGPGNQVVHIMPPQHANERIVVDDDDAWYECVVGDASTSTSDGNSGADNAAGRGQVRHGGYGTGSESEAGDNVRYAQDYRALYASRNDTRVTGYGSVAPIQRLARPYERLRVPGDRDSDRSGSEADVSEDASSVHSESWS
ncbi:hypothetical protein BJ508DRAFT_320266 [Ascobolus immersus RN42]|uniref:Uncharacterized protein n=1 Tax=Ascobolus immersus RN42 TaxID=1160509 RepID=A0A3N4IQU8_ASCIM|nr:hypothetical protein BJ508DRAFT_320266 [Ascobolus immersus RN42]